MDFSKIAVAAAAALTIMVPGISQAAYMGISDDLTTISYVAGNSSGDDLAYAFDGRAPTTPSESGPAVTGSQAASIPLTLTISSANSFTDYSVFFASDGSIVSEFSYVYDSGNDTANGTYTDFLAADTIAPTPTGSDMIVTLGPTSSTIGFAGVFAFGGNITVDTPIPELGGMVLLAAGLAGLGIVRRRRTGRRLRCRRIVGLE